MPLDTVVHAQQLPNAYARYMYGARPAGEQIIQGQGGEPVQQGGIAGQPIDSLIQRVVALARGAYQPYNGSRQAQITPQMLRAEELANQIGGTKPYLNRAVQYLDRSSKPFHHHAREYMNPYEQQVVSRIRDEGMRMLNENILPSLESQFIKAGQFRSSKHRDMAHKAARDISNEILGRQSHALHTGYAHGQHAYNQDMSRLQHAAQQQVNLGALQNAEHLQDIEALRSLGGTRQAHEQQMKDIGYQDFLRQLAFPWQQLQMQSSLMHGLHIPVSETQWSQTPAPQQLNAAGNLGALGTNLLAARFMGGMR